MVFGNQRVVAVATTATLPKVGRGAYCVAIGLRLPGAGDVIELIVEQRNGNFHTIVEVRHKFIQFFDVECNLHVLSITYICKKSIAKTEHETAIKNKNTKVLFSQTVEHILAKKKMI